MKYAKLHLFGAFLTVFGSLYAQSTVAVQNGTAAFRVRTNIPAIEVSGKSADMQAHLRLERDGDDVRLEKIEAWVPAASLKTGMSIRDEHMRRRIFMNDKGEAPDLRFESGEVRCPAVADGKEITCSVAGTLAIRGVARGFTIPLKMRQEHGNSFHANGDGIVKLSDYGIEQPTQLGVKTSNEVNIHLEFNARESALVAATPGGR